MEKEEEGGSLMEILTSSAPWHFRCPISLELMVRPVTLPTGITYDRPNIQRWLSSGHSSCPVTGKSLPPSSLLPNLLLQRLIQTWCLTKLTDLLLPGIQIQITDEHASVTGVLQMLSSITGSYGGNNNTDNNNNNNKEVRLTKKVAEFLKILPLKEEVKLGFIPGKAIEAALLQHGNSEEKLSALELINDLINANPKTHVRLILAKEVKITWILVNLLRPESQEEIIVATVRLLMSLCRVDKKARERAVEEGAVSAVLNLLHGSNDGGLCESLLALLSLYVLNPTGKTAAEKHMAAVPVIVKKILSVSDVATQLAVDCLWSMCRPSKLETRGQSSTQLGEYRVCQEAVRCGALAKALLLLQVPVGVKTKQKAMELIKILGYSRQKKSSTYCSMLMHTHVRQSLPYSTSHSHSHSPTPTPVID